MALPPDVVAHPTRRGSLFLLLMVVFVGSWLVFCPAELFAFVRDIGVVLFLLFLPLIALIAVLLFFRPTRAVAGLAGRAAASATGAAAGAAMSGGRRAAGERPSLLARVELDDGNTVTVSVPNASEGIRQGDRLSVRGLRCFGVVRAVSVRNLTIGRRFVNLGWIATAVVVALLVIVPVSAATAC